MSLLMNILWLVFGGVVTAVEYIVASVGMMVTIMHRLEIRYSTAVTIPPKSIHRIFINRLIPFYF